MSNESKETPNLIQLVYVSAANIEFSAADLDVLLDKARQNNSAIGVTGVLLFHEGTFLQVLEGDEQTVNNLYDKIAEDTRHGNVLLLATRAIDQPNFGDWSMGFVRDQKALEKLPGFVDFFQGRDFIDLRGDSKRVSQILDGFRRGRWHRQSEAIA